MRTGIGLDAIRNRRRVETQERCEVSADRNPLAVHSKQNHATSGVGERDDVFHNLAPISLGGDIKHLLELDMLGLSLRFEGLVE